MESISYQTSQRRHGVVVAIRREDGKFLCIRRAKTLQRAPGKVCFPGGMIEPGEEQPEAVRREMKEELGIDVEPVQQCWHYDLPDKPLTLWGWVGRWISAELRPEASEVEEVIWLTGEEVSKHVDAMDTNPLFVKSLTEERG